MLQPVFTCPDPIRGGDNILVLCEVLNAADMKPHPTNTRAVLEKVAKKYAKQEMIYGIEQEYTMLKPDGTPLGFPARTASPPRRARTTAASAPAGSSAARSSRSTPRRASTPA